MKEVGLVFSGGGGKGAYQIGVWRALRELGIENHVVAVSGTSVGALNAAMFLKGDLKTAEQLWNSISGDALLPLNMENDNSFFSNEGLGTFVRQALSLQDRSEMISCYVTCKRLRDGKIQYYELQRIIDPNYRKQILMASAALPAVFPPVLIDGELFVDGGANGDNTPVYPIFQNHVPIIIVVHLSREDPPCSGEWPNTEVIDIFPSEDLGGFITGVVDFKPERARWRQSLGYKDGKAFLAGVAKWIAVKSITTTSVPIPTPSPQNHRHKQVAQKEILVFRENEGQDITQPNSTQDAIKLPLAGVA